MRVVLGPAGPWLDHGPPVRPAGEHAVRVRIELAGICRSDLKEVAGVRHGVSQFGHEIVGVVEESTAPGLPSGRRVALDPNVGIDRGTGFATSMWAVGPPDRLTAALPAVPPRIAARRLVFAEPLACARHCLDTVVRHLGGSAAGARLGVLGAGTAGVLIALLGQAAGCEVLLANRGAERRSFLRRRGVIDAPVLPPDAVPSGSLDAAVVATSFVLPEILGEALRMAAPGGLVLPYGGTAPGDALPGLDCDLDTVRRRQLTVATAWCGKSVRIAGSYGTAPGDFAAALRHLVDPEVAPERVERLITREVRLAELPRVLRDGLAGPQFGKTLVLP
ncbi:MDR/zinc-dependent alcohol dehydrogenase-like family protein [Kitasatospora camelliae]|uniref:Medium chain dehydrogenase/reductase family protein n=1 Tax=Kitasatospora camelliae TaxID=3156397 RepID=A0AAU8JRT7_9ACTN